MDYFQEFAVSKNWESPAIQGPTCRKQVSWGFWDPSAQSLPSGNHWLEENRKKNTLESEHHPKLSDFLKRMGVNI